MKDLKLTLEQVQSVTCDILKEVDSICRNHNLMYYVAFGSALGTVRHNGPIPWDYDMDLLVSADDYENFFRLMREELSDKYYLDYGDITNSYYFVFPRIGLKGYSTDEIHVDIFRFIGAPADETQIKKHIKKLCFFKYLIYYKKRPIYRNFKSIIGKGAQRLVLFFVPSRYIIMCYNKLMYKYPVVQSNKVIVTDYLRIKPKVFNKDYFGKGVEGSYSDLKVILPEKVHDFLSDIYGDYMTPPPEKERVYKDYYVAKLRK